MPSRCSGPIGSATPFTERMRSSTFAVGYSSRISVELGESNAKTSMPASVSGLRDVGVLGGPARDRRHLEAGEARGMRRVVVAAAVHVARARRRDDGVFGVVADGDEIVATHSRSLTFQSVAARTIDTALDPIQNAIAGPKS